MNRQRKHLSQEEIDKSLAVHSTNVVAAASKDGQTIHFAAEGESIIQGKGSKATQEISAKSLEDVVIQLEQNDIDLSKDLRKIGKEKNIQKNKQNRRK